MVNEKQKYETLIISCWVVLIACFLIKIFGGNWFEIICENQNFINICEWLDRSWVKYIVATLVYAPSSYLIYLCLTKQKLLDDWWILLILIPAPLLKDKIAILGWVIDILVLILLPLIKGKFKNWLYLLIGIGLTFAFQLVSLLTKNITINLTNEPSLIALIMQVDYYIMIILYYLYIQYYRKEKE